MDASTVESDVISGTDTCVVNASLDKSNITSVEDTSVADLSLESDAVSL